MKQNHAIINKSSCITSGCMSNMKAYKYDTVCQKAYSLFPSWLYSLSPWQLSFPDESCPPMRCIRHSHRPGSLFLLTAIHLPTNLTVVGFGFCASLPSPLPIQEILMRVHMFNSGLKEVLTLFLKLGLNSALDIAARVWHFPGKGIFTHLSQAYLHRGRI